MIPSHRRYGSARVTSRRPPIPDLPPEEHRVDDGDTDDRWASAMMLTYFGLLLLVGVAVLYTLSGAGSRVSPAERHAPMEAPSYYLAR